MHFRRFTAAGREARLAAVRDALDRGFSLLPACIPVPGTTRCVHHPAGCPRPGKRTLLRMHNASSDPRVIDAWFKMFYDFNILIKTKESHLGVIDYDVSKCDLRLWENLRSTLPNTFVVRSGSGGEHWYYQSDIVFDDSLCVGIDLRGSASNHVLVYSGSLHPSGELYATICNLPIAPFPEFLCRKLSRKSEINSSQVYSERGSTFLELFFQRCGLVIGDTRETHKGQFITPVRCPLVDTHSGNKEFDMCSTAVISGKGIGSYGKFVCFHESHGGHGSIMSKEAVRLLIKEYPEEYNKALKECDMLPKDLSHIPKCLPLEQAEALLQKTMFEAQTGIVTAVRVTTGLGKTHQLVNDISQRAQPASVFVPTHKLAREVTERLSARGVGVKHARGVTSTTLAPEARCAFPKLAAGAQKLRLPMRSTICLECDLRKECKAFPDTDPDAEVKVLQHAILADAVKQSDDIERIYIDELPSLIDTFYVSAESLRNVFRILKNLGEDSLNPYKYLVDLIVGAIPSLEGKRYFSLREVVGIALNPSEQTAFLWNPEVEKTTQKIRNHELILPEHLKRKLMQHGKNYQDDFLKFADSYQLLNALRRAAIHADRRTIHVRDGHVTIQLPAEWIDVLQQRARNGSTTMLLSATIPSDILRALVPQNLEILDVHAEDGNDVYREHIFDKHCTRTWLCPGGSVRTENAVPLTKQVYDDLVRMSISDALIITYKALAMWLTESEEVYPQLKELIRNGTIKVAWYGGIVGIDEWKKITCVYTLGNPIPNLDAMKNEAEVLQVPADDYVRWRTDAELVQSVGRGRACRREDKLRIVHRGRSVPAADMAPQFYL